MTNYTRDRRTLPVEGEMRYNGNKILQCKPILFTQNSDWNQDCCYQVKFIHLAIARWTEFHMIPLKFSSPSSKIKLKNSSFCQIFVKQHHHWPWPSSKVIIISYNSDQLMMWNLKAPAHVPVILHDMLYRQPGLPVWLTWHRSPCLSKEVKL